MAQRHKRRSKRQAAKGLLSQATKYLPMMAFASTFYGNAVDNINSQTTVGGKVKTLVNATTGKVIGINFFNDAPKFGVAITPQNMLNPLTSAGATLMVIGIVGKKLGLPRAGTLKSVGSKIAIPSAIGALFGGDVGTGFIQTSPQLTTGGTAI